MSEDQNDFFGRRWYDNATGHRIEQLIEQTADPVQRATLLVLQKIDFGLDSVVQVSASYSKKLEELHEEFKRHDATEINEKGQMLGMKQTAKWFMALVMALVGGIATLGGVIVTEHRDRLSMAESEIVKLRIELSRR